MEKTRLLFLCTGNSARSQMAEAFMRKYADDRFEVYSAGLEPKALSPFMLRVMEEAGFDMSGHRSKGLGEYLGRVNFEYLVTVCDEAERNCPTFLPGVDHRLHWSFEDPAKFEGSDEQKLARFRQVRDLIDARVRTWLSEQKIPVAV
jgi:arsenate reductase (thioredoxin)